MSVFRFVVLRCDEPGCPSAIDHDTVVEARRTARGRGWVRRRAPSGRIVDLCRAHADVDLEEPVPGG